jgi:Fe-S-cluster containining protein
MAVAYSPLRQTEISSNGEPRSQVFGYTCHRCMRCCYNKCIQINPYESARLARNLDQTTTEFRAAWTLDGAGTVLKQTDTGACVFLGDDGCTVHPDRPLVCRLYPLGRRVLTDGTESFSRTEGHPQSAGEFTKDSTIADFLESQDVAPFAEAADEYFQWLCAAQDFLGADGPPDRPVNLAESANLAADLIDFDTSIARYCAATGAAEPTDIEERKRLHLELLYGKLADDNGRKT